MKFLNGESADAARGAAAVGALDGFFMFVATEPLDCFAGDFFRLAVRAVPADLAAALPPDARLGVRFAGAVALAVPASRFDRDPAAGFAFEAAFFTGAFFAAGFLAVVLAAAAFLVAAFPVAAFFDALLAVVFFVAAFLVAGLLAARFIVGFFFALALPAVDFFRVDDFPAAFFGVGGVLLLALAAALAAAFVRGFFAVLSRFFAAMGLSLVPDVSRPGP